MVGGRGQAGKEQEKGEAERWGEAGVGGSAGVGGPSTAKRRPRRQHVRHGFPRRKRRREAPVESVGVGGGGALGGRRQRAWPWRAIVAALRRPAAGWPRRCRGAAAAQLGGPFLFRAKSGSSTIGLSERAAAVKH